MLFDSTRARARVKLVQEYFNEEVVDREEQEQEESHYDKISSGLTLLEYSRYLCQMSDPKGICESPNEIRNQTDMMRAKMKILRLHHELKQDENMILDLVPLQLLRYISQGLEQLQHNSWRDKGSMTLVRSQ